MLLAGPSAPCSGLVPEAWAAGVESADFPGELELATARRVGDGALPWQLFAVRQTGQLDKANERTADTLSIVRKCEARDRAAAEEITGRSLWQRLTPWRE